MAKIYDVVAITGTYTGADGKEKKRYATLGAVIETKHGLMLKLETIPVTWEGMAYLNDPRKREEPKRDDPPPFDDRVPF